MRRLSVIAVVCLLAGMAFAQVSVGISPTPKLQFSDVNGVPLAGGLIDTFDCGTTNPRATYTDSTGATPNGNPVALDSGGFASIWLFGCTKMRVKNSASVAQYTIDNINILPPWAVVTNPTGTQTISGAALALNNNFTLLQNTAATAIANQTGFSFCQNGSYWTGAVTAIDQFCWQDVLGTGSNPTSRLTLTHSGSSGAVALSPTVDILFSDANRTIGFADQAASPRTLTIIGSPGKDTGSAGGDLSIKGGLGSPTSGTSGGGVAIAGGASQGGNGNGGSVTVAAGASTGVGNGSAVTVTASNSGAGATGNGGAVNVTAGSAASTNGNGGNIIITPGTKTGAGTAGAIVFSNNIYGDASGFKHKRFGATTATAAVAGATADTVFTWPTTFVDANYTVSCTGEGITGVPAIVGFAGHVAATITLRVVAITAVAASYTSVDCIAVHD